MVWLWFALVYILARGTVRIIHRKLLPSADGFSYAATENVVGALFFIPFLLLSPVFPTAWQAWMLVAIASCFWIVIYLIAIQIYKTTPVSLSEPVRQTELLFVFVLSILFLAEAITAQKIVGAALIFFGTVVLTYKDRRLFGRFTDKGVLLAVCAALLAAIVGILEKRALLYFTPLVYGFLVYCIPGIFFALFLPSRFEKAKELYRASWHWLLVMIALSALGSFAGYTVYQLTELSIAYPVMKLSLLVTVLGSMLFLQGEQEYPLRKICAALLMIGGAVFLSFAPF